MKSRLFRVLIPLAMLLSGLGLSQNRPALIDEMGYADTILVNGKIVSMDDRSIVPETPGHIFEAMAIKGKKIMTLGSTGEIRLLAGPKTQVIVLAGGKYDRDIGTWQVCRFCRPG